MSKDEYDTMSNDRKSVIANLKEAQKLNMLDVSDHMSAHGVKSIKSGGKHIMPEIKEKDDTTDESIEMIMMQNYKNK